MATISILKWSLFIFPVMYSLSSGCETTYIDCYYDIDCTYGNDISENFYEYHEGSPNGTCISKGIFVNNVNGYRYIPIRIKFGSEYSLEAYLSDLNDNDDIKNSLVSLELTDISLSATPDLQDWMDNLKTLNLSNNVLTRAKLFNQANLKALENIDLSHNNINSIQVDDSQYVYRELRVLNLSHNLLTDIIGGVFEQFKHLEYLDLSYNNIISLDHSSFEGLNKTRYVSLSHNNITGIKDSLVGFSDLEEIYFDNNNIEKISIRDFETLRNLRTLSLEFNRISSIEKDTFSKTKYLTTLKLQHNLLKQIYKDAFLSTSSLKTIDLSNNLIQNLPKNLFINKNITSFSIIGNNLEGSITKGTFEGLQLITELDVSHQAITDVGDFAFLSLNKLTMLLLNSNEIKSISEHSFHTLISLKQLDLSNNLLVSVEFSKQDLLSLEMFYLNNNFIKQILYGDFQGLKRLRFLDMSNNNVSKLETSCFKVVDTIESIQLFNNPINGALSNNSFIGLHLVPILDLSRTSITSIANGTFSGMVQLQEFNVSRSSVHEVQYDAFVNTGSIQSIDLSFNILTEFVVNGKDLPNLTRIYLNNNAINQITNYVFKHLRALKSCDLSFNNISFIQPGAFKDNVVLYNLNLSHNALISLNYGAFRGLIGLNTLDVSYNTIQDLKKEKFFDTPNLKILIADYNRITDVSNDFVFINLDTLSIGHNLLSCDKVISLKQYGHYSITAVNIDEISNDNIDGIVCDMNKHKKIPELGIHETKVNTTTYKRILLNSSEKRDVKIIPDSNNTYLLQDLLNKVDNISVKLSRTNSLLERITLVEDSFNNNKISHKNTSYVQNSTSLGNDSRINALNVNQTKQELEKVISETDSKVSLQKLLSSILEKINKSEHEVKENANTGRSFIFVEVCVSLILLMLLCFFLYKFYETKIFKRTRSLSTRHITDTMDNSNL